MKIGTDDVGSSKWWRQFHDWADVIHADFQTVISRYLQNISTYLFCTAERMLRTIIMQNSRMIQACFPIKIDEVWINRFCVRYDWWRRLQPTSSVSPVWYMPYCCHCSAVCSIKLYMSCCCHCSAVCSIKLYMSCCCHCSAVCSVKLYMLCCHENHHPYDATGFVSFPYSSHTTCPQNLPQMLNLCSADFISGSREHKTPRVWYTPVKS